MYYGPLSAHHKFHARQCEYLITYQEESYRLWSVVACTLETSWIRTWPAPSAGRGGGREKCTTFRGYLQCDLMLWNNERHRSEMVVYIRYTHTYLKLSFLFSAAISLTLQFSTNPILHYKHTLNLSCLVSPCPFGAINLRHKAVVNADEQCC
jgi:hypothetical protein